MKIRAFHGLRYNGTAEQAGANAAPPYDQINDALRDTLHEREHHFAHLIRPVPNGSASAHENSAQLHSRWLSGDILVRDPRRALYGNSIEPPEGEVRFGLTALIDIEEPGHGIIRPHEETVDKTVAERLSLLRTTELDYEPILLLADDGGALDTLLAEDCSGSPAATHVDEFGNTHRLYPIASADRIARYRTAVESSYGLIADGHHRYKTARLYATETSAARGTAAGAKLGVITSLGSTALTIDPIHRAMPLALDPVTMAPVTRARAAVGAPGGKELARLVADAQQPALGILSPDGKAEVWQLDPEHGPKDLPRAASDLSVVLLHRTLFPLAGLTPGNATDGTLSYRSNAEELAAAVRQGDFAAGIFLPPMTPAGFAAAVADGDVLPPKSTRFLPKVVSGLVWAAHADAVD